MVVVGKCKNASGKELGRSPVATEIQNEGVGELWGVQSQGQGRGVPAAEELGKCFRRTVCSEKMWYL